ncbi:Holliday junction branch migration protein RuvA [Actinoplanes sp. CA-054009]
MLTGEYRVISVVAGDVRSVERDRAVVDVGGLGLEVVLVGPFAATLCAGDRVVLHTLVVRRPDGMTLSGFASRDELDLFVMVMETPGVGATTARAALGMLGHEGLVEAIRRGHEPTLRKIPGVGARAAAMLLVTLRPRLGAVVDAGTQSGGGERRPPNKRAAPGHGDAIAALQSLGWKKRDAVRAVEEASSATSESAGVQGLIRAALAVLGPKR